MNDHDEKQSKTRPAYLIAGGGTGGHLYPAIAIADGIRKSRPESDIHFVGTAKGLESRIVPRHGYPLHLITVRGMARHFTLANVMVPFRLAYSMMQCFSLLRRIRPRVVIGTGGYVSGPVVYSATLLGYRTLVQEQNSVPGVTTRLLASRVDRVHLSFNASKSYFKKTKNLHVTGNPIRAFDLIYSAQSARNHFGLAPNRPTLLLFGGSQGAMSLNRALIDALETLMRNSDLQILWSCGSRGFAEAKTAADTFQGRIKVIPFIAKMALAYQASDLAVCRAGALTLAEITYCGLPSILVPYPHAAGGHQEKNARQMAERGAAILLPQPELSGETLARHILSAVEDRAKMKEMGLTAKSLSYPRATADLVESVFDLEKQAE